MKILDRTVRSLLPAVAALMLGAAVPCADAAEEAAPPAPAQERKEVPPDLQKVLDGLESANKNVQDVRAEVHYLREIPLLDEKQESDGVLEFRKPDLIHLKLGKPRNEEVYCDGKTWYVISHDDKQVEKYEAAQDEGAATEASFLTFGYGQGPQKILEKYDVTLTETRNEKSEATGKEATVYRLRFVPRDEDAPARFAVIETELADDLWLPRTIVLHESEGEIVHTFQLREIELNPGFDEEDFTCEPPKGYQVIEP